MTPLSKNVHIGYWHFLHLVNVVDNNLFDWSETGGSDD